MFGMGVLCFFAIWFCRFIIIIYNFGCFVPYSDFKQPTFGHARQVKVTTTYSTVIHQSRRFPNRSAFRTGIVECWTKPSLIVLSVITRQVLMSAGFLLHLTLKLLIMHLQSLGRLCTAALTVVHDKMKTAE